MAPSSHPGIGGETMTFTNGRTSSYINNSDGLWVKTDTKIDSGNSGGAVVDQNLNLIGVPTYTITSTESIAYFKPLSDVKDEIEQFLKEKPQSNISAKQELRRVMKTNLEAQNSDEYENEYPNYSIKLEDAWHFDYIDLASDNTVYIENEDHVFTMQILAQPFPYEVTPQDYIEWSKSYNADALYTDYYELSDYEVNGRETYRYYYSSYPYLGEGLIFTAGNYAFDVYLLADQEASLAFDYDQYFEMLNEFDEMMSTFRILEEPIYETYDEYDNGRFYLAETPSWHLETYPSDPDSINFYREGSVALVTVMNYPMSHDAWVSADQDMENIVANLRYDYDDVEVLSKELTTVNGYPFYKMVYEYKTGRSHYREVFYRYVNYELAETLDIIFYANVDEFNALMPEVNQIIGTLEIY